MSIHKKMAEGAVWILLERLGAQAASFVVFIIIARFVGPEEYGLVSLCYIYLGLAFTLFSSIVDGVINLHIHDNLRLSSLFWCVAGGGIFLSVICFASAPSFAAVMEQPRLVSLLRWFSILPLLFALASVPTVIVTNSMNFRIFTIRTMVANLLSGIVGVIMAVKGFGAYAIIAQQAVLYSVTNIIIWWGSGWHPRFMFSLCELLNILKPGVKMSGSLFITFFEQQMPRLLIGHFLGAEAVGHFSFVTRICQSLHEVFVYPLSTVSYPALTRLMGSKAEQKQILALLITLSGAIVFPCVVWAMVTAPIYVPLFFGAKWIAAISALQIFLVTMLSLPLTTIVQNALRAHNRMGSYLKLQAFLTAGLLILAWLLVSYGLEFMLSGIAVFSLLSIPVYIRLVTRKIQISLWQDFMHLWGPGLSSIAMAMAVYAFNRSDYLSQKLWEALLADIVLGVVVYAIAYSALQFRQMQSLLRFIKEEISRRMRQTEQATMMEKTMVSDLPQA